MNEACELLLERKEEENWELRKKLKAPLKDFQITTEAEGENRIIVIPTGKNDNAWQKEWNNVQKSADLIILFNKFSQWGQSHAEENMRTAADRNVKIRVIVEKGIEEKLSGSKAFVFNMIAKFTQIKFKSAAKLPSTEMGVFDNKKLFLCIQNDSNLRKMGWLYTDNPLIVEIAKVYFENLWTRIAQDVEEKQKEK